MLVPKLRFKEFTDEWESNELKNIALFFKGNGYSKNDLSETGRDCILYGELYTTYNEIINKIKSKTNKYLTSQVLCKINDVIIPASGETPEDIAKASCILQDNVILGSDLNIIRLNDIDGRFFAYQINNKRKKELANLAQGHSVVHLYYEKFKSVKINYPTITEQNKISNFLSLLDKKIELQTKKIEVLKLYKKGLNFIVFDDKKNINNYSLNNLIEEYNEKTSKNNQYPVLSSTLNGIFMQESYFNKKASSSDTTNYKIIPKEYITYRSMSDTGEFHFNEQTLLDYGIVSPAYPVFKFSENVNQGYVINYMNENNYFKNKLLCAKEGGTRYALGLKKLQQLDINLPNKEKQDFYFNCINTIVVKLNKENRKLYILQHMKKGLMQKMFV